VSALGRQVLAHLDEQLDSTRRLLAAILAQGSAIRSQDVEGVLARLADVKGEMSMRARLEDERSLLLAQAGAQLGVPAQSVTLDAIATLMVPAEADAARARSAELRGLLDEIAREHGLNRALMRQELSFLDHLVRMLGAEPEAGYGMPTVQGPGGAPAARHHVVNVQV
jgi:FlgN protein